MWLLLSMKTKESPHRVVRRSNCRKCVGRKSWQSVSSGSHSTFTGLLLVLSSFLARFSRWLAMHIKEKRWHSCLYLVLLFRLSPTHSSVCLVIGHGEGWPPGDDVVHTFSLVHWLMLPA